MEAGAKSPLCVDMNLFTQCVTHSKRLHKCYLFAGWIDGAGWQAWVLTGGCCISPPIDTEKVSSACTKHLLQTFLVFESLGLQVRQASAKGKGPCSVICLPNLPCVPSGSMLLESSDSLMSEIDWFPVFSQQRGPLLQARWLVRWKPRPRPDCVVVTHSPSFWPLLA